MPKLIRDGLMAGALLACVGPRCVFAQGRPVALAATRANANDLRAWDQQIDQMIRARELRVRETERDAMLPDRRHERLDQYYRGVRIVGGDLTRQSDAGGTVSIFGLLHADIDIDPTPRLTPAAARQAISGAVSGTPRDADPELVIFPLSDGYHLAYLGQAITDVDLVNVFVDANNGALLRRFSDLVTEVGTGTGTYGDLKKISVKAVSGAFIADDALRPTEISTYDMKSNLSRAQSILFNGVAPSTADFATNSNNQWTDGAVVDAHVYAGWYYDYLQKRFSRKGLDDRDLRIPVLVHPVALSAIATATRTVVGTYYLNAFWCSSCMPDRRGSITLGEGAPRGFLAPGVEVKPFSAALDVVAHELTHGVTANTARLSGFAFGDAGALNEAFSDIFGTSTEFFYQPPGTGLLKADYLIGEDLAAPFGALVIRSLADPVAFGATDHYSQRNPAADPHPQSTIASHAFHLAIEGGTNRTSRLTVQGVGSGNRDQIEKVFFRALTLLLPSNATFALTRDATIQAARDLYGAGSSVERAVTQAWDAVGVQDRVAPASTMLPNPATGTTNACGGVAPSWVLGITASAGASSLQITQWTFEVFDSAGRSLDRDVLSPASFAQFFAACGPGSSRILAQTDACAAVCVDLGGRSSGFAQASFTATDSSGRTVAFGTDRVTLAPPK